MENIWNQYWTTTCANLYVLSYAIAFGWCSPSLPVLLSDESPLSTGPITIDESAWISSILCIGMAFGAFFSGSLIERWGRIRLLIAMGPVKIAGWLLTIFAQNVYYLYGSRFIMGFLGSAMFVVIPVFVAEIAHDSVRGSLGSILPLVFNFGIFLAFLIAATLHVKYVPYAGLIFTLTCLITLMFIPETPQYLLTCKEFDKVEKSLAFYKGTDANLEKHVENQPNAGEEQKPQKSKVTMADVRDPATRKAIIISIVLVPISQLCGILVILNYMAQIFEEAHISIDANYASCVVAALQFLGSYLSIVLVERLGRKLLIATSSFGTGVFLILMGAHDFFKTALHMDMSAYGWLPLLSLSGVCFISATGMNMMPYVVSAEVLPQNIRASVIGNCTVLRSLVSFVYLQYFNWLIFTLHLYGSMGLFAVFCFFCTTFVLIVVPETKGKSFEAIRKSLQ